MGLPSWFQKAYRALVIEVFFLIALGGAVRVMNAGLACPDWPLCFGDVIPDYHPQVYLEFIHRALAGVVAIATVVLHVALFRSQVSRAIKWVAALSLVLLVAQVLMGALTVWLQLHSKVVAAHLGLALAYYSTLIWIYLATREDAKAPQTTSWSFGLAWSKFVYFAVFAQMLLGGLVASHYASLVCTDFPTCHGQWFPTFKGIIGLHVIHRLGAYTVFGIVALGWWLAYRYGNSAEVRRARSLFFVVCVQVGVGIANVLLMTPPLIAVIHLATGTIILMLALRQVFHYAVCTVTPGSPVASRGGPFERPQVSIGFARDARS